MDVFDEISHLEELRGVQAQTPSSRSAAEWDATFKVICTTHPAPCLFSLSLFFFSLIFLTFFRRRHARLRTNCLVLPRMRTALKQRKSTCHIKSHTIIFLCFLLSYFILCLCAQKQYRCVCFNPYTPTHTSVGRWRQQCYTVCTRRRLIVIG